ncbi:MAG: hypothetical protein PHT80_15085, partial [Lentisphaeria bacterium]|nr:hypothetical protein [Lentisphaeria bacterium]
HTFIRIVRQRSAEIKVEWPGGSGPWVSCNLSPGFFPPGWLLTNYGKDILGRICCFEKGNFGLEIEKNELLNAYGPEPPPSLQIGVDRG